MNRIKTDYFLFHSRYPIQLLTAEIKQTTAKPANIVSTKESNAALM